MPVLSKRPLPSIGGFASYASDEVAVADADVYFSLSAIAGAIWSNADRSVGVASRCWPLMWVANIDKFGPIQRITGNTTNVDYIRPGLALRIPLMLTREQVAQARQAEDAWCRLSCWGAAVVYCPSMLKLGDEVLAGPIQSIPRAQRSTACPQDWIARAREALARLERDDVTQQEPPPKQASVWQRHGKKIGLGLAGLAVAGAFIVSGKDKGTLGHVGCGGRRRRGC